MILQMCDLLHLSTLAASRVVSTWGSECKSSCSSMPVEYGKAFFLPSFARQNPHEFANLLKTSYFGSGKMLLKTVRKF